VLLPPDAEGVFASEEGVFALEKGVPSVGRVCLRKGRVCVRRGHACRDEECVVASEGVLSMNTATIRFFSYRAVEPDSRIAVLWHFSHLAN